jgi:choline kinase
VNAIILAAGLGSRLGPLTGDRPKCLLTLHGRTILEWQLSLLEACGVEDITVVVGYRAESIRAVAGSRVRYVFYANFATTNNLHTLQRCGQALAGDVVILFADVLVERGALARCLAGAVDAALLVDTAQRRPDTMRVRLADGCVADIGAHVTVQEADGNFVGIAKYSARGADRLRGELDRMIGEGGFENAYYTEALPRLAAQGESIGIVTMDGERWREIDNEADYRLACAERFYVTC